MHQPSIVDSFYIAFDLDNKHSFPVFACCATHGWNIFVLIMTTLDGGDHGNLLLPQIVTKDDNVKLIYRQDFVRKHSLIRFCFILVYFLFVAGFVQRVYNHPGVHASNVGIIKTR